MEHATKIESRIRRATRFCAGGVLGFLFVASFGVRGQFANVDKRSPLLGTDIPAWVVAIHLDDKNYVESHFVPNQFHAARLLGGKDIVEAHESLLSELRVTGPGRSVSYLVRVQAEKGAVFHVTSKDGVLVVHSMIRDKPLTEIEIESSYLVVFALDRIDRVVSIASKTVLGHPPGKR
jgi:hypothetical protein